MSHRPFSNPLLLKLPVSGTFVADSVWELSEYLDLFWPENDPELEALKQLCEDSLDGWIGAASVRARACDAARKSGLLETSRSSIGFRAVRNDWLSKGDVA